MQIFRSRLMLASLSVVGAAALMACTSASDNGGGGSGGKAGSSSGGGGGSGGKAGSGGGSGGSNGGSGGGGSSGGTAGGGSGGSAGDSGGSGGGGAGGTAGAGGAGMGGAGMGGAGMGGAAGMVSAGAPEFCKSTTFRPGAVDGIHTGEEIAAGTDPRKGNPAGVVRGKMEAGGTNYAAAWVPGKYDTAAAGEVALVILAESYVGMLNIFASNVDNWAHTGEIPVTMVVTAKDSWPALGGKIPAMIQELKAKYSKLSDKPEYRSVTGQSTAGAHAFDYIWDHTDSVSTAITGSASLVCFMRDGGNNPDNNDVYVKLIAGSPKKNIRFSTIVGNCDIFGSLDLRLGAGCPAGTGDGAVDASSCHATWIDVNKSVNGALKAKGYPHHLLIQGTAQNPGGHIITTWQSNIGDQLRWVFRPLICK